MYTYYLSKYRNDSALSGQSMLGVTPVSVPVRRKKGWRTAQPFSDKIITNQVMAMAMAKVLNVLILVLPGFVLGISVKDVGHVGLVSGKWNLSSTHCHSQWYYTFHKTQFKSRDTVSTGTTRQPKRSSWGFITEFINMWAEIPSSRLTSGTDWDTRKECSAGTTLTAAGSTTASTARGANSDSSRRLVSTTRYMLRRATLSVKLS